jgi:putative membrane protein
MPLTRATYLGLGIFCLAAIWLGPLPNMAGQSFSAHMLMHMGVVAVAAPLIAIGLAGAPFDPVRRWPAFFAPIPLSAIELIVVWAWHAPRLHHYARHEGMIGLCLEQSTFLISGLLLWLSAFAGPLPRERSRSGAGIAGLLLTSMHMTLLGALLALAPRPLYDHARSSATSLSALDDQHLGGTIMLLIGGVSYLLGGLWLTAGLVRRRVTA